MYKSKIILSSLTVLGLAGAGALGSNYIGDVNAESNVTKQVETIASQVDKFKSKEEVKPKSTVYAEDLKPESVHEQLINNAISESEYLNNDEIESENVEEEIVEDSKSETVESTDLSSDEDTTSISETYDAESVIETNIETDVYDVKEADVKEESPKLEDVTVNDVVDTKTEDVSEQPKVEEYKNEIIVETPVLEEKFEDVKSTEEIKPIETSTEVTEEPKVEFIESVVEQPKEETQVEETKVETSTVENFESKPTLTNPINDKTNTYPIGQCTWGVKALADWVGNYWGNANQWGDSARKAGYTTGSTPQVGSVIVFPNSIYEGVNYGHVAYVTNVYEDGTIEVLESNYNGVDEQIKNYRGRFNPNQPRYGGVYYIYPNA